MMNEMKSEAQFITTTFRPELLDAGDKVRTFRLHSQKALDLLLSFTVWSTVTKCHT